MQYWTAIRKCTTIIVGVLLLLLSTRICSQKRIKASFNVFISINSFIGRAFCNLILPSARSRSWKVIHYWGAVFSCSENVSHASLVRINAAELRDFSFVLLSLIELNVVSVAINMALQRFTLLWLWVLWLSHLLVQLQGEGLLHTIPGYRSFLIIRLLLSSVLFCRGLKLRVLWDGQLPFAPKWTIQLSWSCLLNHLNLLCHHWIRILV